MSKKQKPHEKIAVVLLSGKPVSPDEIKASFASDKKLSALLYRLSTYIYDIRKYGGIVKVLKDGRKVSGYQLVNFSEFNAEGRYVGKQQAVQAPVAVVEQSEVVESVEA